MVFNMKQMKEIELGKKSGIDVEIYAKPEFDARQMKALRLSLEDGIDVTPYARPELPARVMDNARICIKRGKDILKYLDKDVYEPSHSDLLICLIRRGEDIKFLEDPRFTGQQRRIIMQGIKEGVPAAFMPKPDVPEKDMKASFELMKTAKTDMVDLNTYVPSVRDEEDVFDYRQKEVISLGERNGLDTSVYAKKCFSALQMRRILDGLKRGVDVSIYARPEVSVQEMGAILNVISKEGAQALDPYMKDFTAAQLGEIALGMVENVDYTVYAKPELEVKQMRAIRIGLREGMDMIAYVNENIKLNTITDKIIEKSKEDKAGNSVKKMKLF